MLNSLYNFFLMYPCLVQFTYIPSFCVPVFFCRISISRISVMHTFIQPHWHTYTHGRFSFLCPFAESVSMVSVMHTSIQPHLTYTHTHEDRFHQHSRGDDPKKFAVFQLTCITCCFVSAFFCREAFFSAFITVWPASIANVFRCRIHSPVWMHMHSSLCARLSLTRDFTACVPGCVYGWSRWYTQNILLWPCDAVSDWNFHRVSSMRLCVRKFPRIHACMLRIFRFLERWDETTFFSAIVDQQRGRISFVARSIVIIANFHSGLLQVEWMCPSLVKSLFCWWLRFKKKKAFDYGQRNGQKSRDLKMLESTKSVQLHRSHPTAGQTRNPEPHSLLQGRVTVSVPLPAPTESTTTERARRDSHSNPNPPSLDPQHSLIATGKSSPEVLSRAPGTLRKSRRFPQSIIRHSRPQRQHARHAQARARGCHDGLGCHLQGCVECRVMLGCSSDCARRA